MFKCRCYFGARISLVDIVEGIKPLIVPDSFIFLIVHLSQFVLNARGTTQNLRLLRLVISARRRGVFRFKIGGSASL